MPSNIPADIEVVFDLLNLKKILAPHLLQNPLLALFEDTNHLRVFLFINFISSIPFYGFCSVCIDHPRVQKIFSNLKNRKIITYGLSPNADVKADNIMVKNQKMYFDVIYKNKTNDKNLIIKNISFSMLGIHNIQNALASISIALEISFFASTKFSFRIAIE